MKQRLALIAAGATALALVSGCAVADVGYAPVADVGHAGRAIALLREAQSEMEASALAVTHY